MERVRVILAFLGFALLLIGLSVAGFVWLVGQLVLGLWKPHQGLL